MKTIESYKSACLEGGCGAIWGSEDRVSAEGPCPGCGLFNVLITAEHYPCHADREQVRKLKAELHRI